MCDHTRNTYNELKKKLKKYRFTHNLAGKYYGSLYQRLTIPTIIITGVVSMGGFLASSEIISENVKNGFTITVGVLGSISTIIQSILHSCEYATKKKMFEQAADEYDKLITKLDFINSCRYNGIQEQEDYMTNMNEMEEEILKIKSNCNYLPPLFIIEKCRNNKHKEEYEDSKKSNERIKNTNINIEKHASNKNNVDDFLLTTDVKKSSRTEKV